MTDPQSPLFNPPWTDDTPLDQIPAEHRDAVEQARATAAGTAPNPAQDGEGAGDQQDLGTAPAPRVTSAKTRARVTGTAPRKSAGRPGARPRKSAAPEPVEPEADRVAVVMQTSRFTGRNGRAVARRTTALVTVSRGLELIIQNAAREATSEEFAAALAATPRVYID